MCRSSWCPGRTKALFDRTTDNRLHRHYETRERGLVRWSMEVQVQLEFTCTGCTVGWWQWPDHWLIYQKKTLRRRQKHHFPKTTEMPDISGTATLFSLTVFWPIRSEVKALEVIWAVVIPIPSKIVPESMVIWMEIPKVFSIENMCQKRLDANRTAIKPRIIVGFLPKYWFTVRIGNDVRKPLI